MTLAEVIKSGKEFKRKDEPIWIKPDSFNSYSEDEVLSKNLEIKEEGSIMSNSSRIETLEIVTQNLSSRLKALEK